MRPGVLRHVTPWFRARPERGSTKPAHPDGTAIAMPVGTSARPPAESRCASTEAYRSYPASSGCCAAGRGRSASSRRMRTCIFLLVAVASSCGGGRQSGHRREPSGYAQVLDQLRPLLLGELNDRVVVRMVDDDPHRARSEGVDLLRREPELEVVHGGGGLLTGEALLVLGDARHR